MPRRYAIAIALAAPAFFPVGPAMAQQADHALVKLVSDFVEAECNFDQARLATLVTADYAEVSPLGELDLREAFLGFYAADKKRPVPPTTIGEPLVRVYGDAASIIVRLSFEIPGRGTVAMRASFLAVKQGGQWKIASAQYTPERPKGPPPAPPAPPKP